MGASQIIGQPGAHYSQPGAPAIASISCCVAGVGNPCSVFPIPSLFFTAFLGFFTHSLLHCFSSLLHSFTSSPHFSLRPLSFVIQITVSANSPIFGVQSHQSKAHDRFFLQCTRNPTGKNEDQEGADKGSEEELNDFALSLDIRQENGSPSCRVSRGRHAHFD